MSTKRLPDKSKELAAAWMEINIQLHSDKFYGPRAPLPTITGMRGGAGINTEYKFNQQYEMLTCLGKSWRSAR